MYAAINSMHGCSFTAFAYFLEPFLARIMPDFILGKLLLYMPRLTMLFIDISMYNKSYEAITGIKLSQRKMLRAGRRIHLLERHLNTLEGITMKDDTLPERFLSEGRKSDPNNHTVPLKKMLKKYYKLKGYDTNGIPLKKVLHKLQLI
jgi:aldehyde:ferredoxin oxidoreductase